MSLIYTKLTLIVNKISDLTHQSLLFTIIFSILSYFENAWVNSYFKGFYPSKDFLSFVKKNKILNSYLFHPLIVLVVFGAFLLLSINSVSNSLALTLAIAFIAFFIGSTILPRYFLNKEFKKPIIQFKSRDLYSIGFCLVLISILFFFISVASVDGIPILKTSLRYQLKPILTMPVFLIIPGICILASVYLKQFQENIITRSQARFRFLLLITISSAFLLALGYRTPLLAVLLIMIIIGYCGNILAVWEVVMGALIGVCAIIGIGYFRSIGDYGISQSTSPIYTLKSRADFTLNVLNLLDFIGENFGLTHGQVLASSIPGSDLGPRMMIGKLIAWRSEVTVTPTLIGQMVIDFGKLGVTIGMCALGFILGIGHKIMKKTKDYFYIGLYGLLLTYSILGVETGILDIQVLVYFTIAIFIYIAFIIKNGEYT